MENRKHQRTTQQQLQFYLQFCRDHPELQAGKNNPCAPRLQRDLWAQLASCLNAMCGPNRTPEKWKENLNLWRNQVRCRARKGKVEQHVTGGGPYAYQYTLTELQEQAINTFGASAVEGIGSTRSLGFRQETVATRSPSDCPSPSNYASFQVASPSPSGCVSVPLVSPSPSDCVSVPLVSPSPSDCVSVRLVSPSPSGGVSVPLVSPSPSGGVSVPLVSPSPSDCVSVPLVSPSPSDCVSIPPTSPSDCRSSSTMIPGRRKQVTPQLLYDELQQITLQREAEAKKQRELAERTIGLQERMLQEQRETNAALRHMGDAILALARAIEQKK